MNKNNETQLDDATSFNNEISKRLHDEQWSQRIAQNVIKRQKSFQIKLFSVILCCITIFISSFAISYFNNEQSEQKAYYELITYIDELDSYDYDLLDLLK